MFGVCDVPLFCFVNVAGAVPEVVPAQVKLLFSCDHIAGTIYCTGIDSDYEWNLLDRLIGWLIGHDNLPGTTFGLGIT